MAAGLEDLGGPGRAITHIVNESQPRKRPLAPGANPPSYLYLRTCSKKSAGIDKSKKKRKQLVQRQLYYPWLSNLRFSIKYKYLVKSQFCQILFAADVFRENKFSKKEEGGSGATPIVVCGSSFSPRSQPPTSFFKCSLKS